MKRQLHLLFGLNYEESRVAGGKKATKKSRKFFVRT